LERRGSVLFPSAADFFVDRKWISLYRPYLLYLYEYCMYYRIRCTTGNKGWGDVCVSRYLSIYLLYTKSTIRRFKIETPH
jgi:hypothetical protein